MPGVDAPVKSGSACSVLCLPCALLRQRVNVVIGRAQSRWFALFLLSSCVVALFREWKVVGKAFLYFLTKGVCL